MNESTKKNMKKARSVPGKEGRKRVGQLTSLDKALLDKNKLCQKAEGDVFQHEALYRTLIETMSSGLIALDQKGVIIYVNRQFCEMLRYAHQELIGRPVINFFDDSNRDVVLEQGARIRKGESVSYESAWIAKGGQRVVLMQSSTPIIDTNGNFRGSITVTTDVSRHKQVEEALRAREEIEEAIREREEHFRSILQTAGSAIILLSSDRKILEFNNTAELIFGYNRNEVVGKDYVQLVFPEKTREAEAEVIDRIIAGDPLRGFENRIKARDGTVRDMLWNATPWLDRKGQVMGCIGSGIDITKQKQNEKALRESEQKLRHLSEELINAQEKERKRISIELHDELGQSLTTLKLQLRGIKTKLFSASSSLESDWIQAFEILGHVIKSTRNLSRGLSPIIIEDLGIASTLRWLIEDFSRRCNMRCLATIANLDEFFTPESQVVIYRIFQECLLNIAKHANASQVSIVVKDNGDAFSFCIEDNGKGFDLREASHGNIKAPGMGILVMEERVSMLKGRLEIRTENGGGTTVNIVLPKTIKP